MAFWWHFTPDAADTAAHKGASIPVLGDDQRYKTESQAIWHGKRWAKECHRTGTVTAVPAKASGPAYILDI